MFSIHMRSHSREPHLPCKIVPFWSLIMSLHASCCSQRPEIITQANLSCYSNSWPHTWSYSSYTNPQVKCNHPILSSAHYALPPCVVSAATGGRHSRGLQLHQEECFIRATITNTSYNWSPLHCNCCQW